jgi:hypothetical protein
VTHFEEKKRKKKHKNMRTLLKWDRIAWSISMERGFYKTPKPGMIDR